MRQPQSHQAVSGILSLLQAELPNSHLEVIQEDERTGDHPLLVVLYNLSNLITEAKAAFDDIEGISRLKFSYFTNLTYSFYFY